MTKQSGIITLLTTGIVMSHYAWFNLSPQGKSSSHIVFQFLGYAAEAFVFAYLGLTFFSYTSLKWSFDLFIVELLIIFFGRFIGTVGMFSFLNDSSKDLVGLLLGSRRACLTLEGIRELVGFLLWSCQARLTLEGIRELVGFLLGSRRALLTLEGIGFGGAVLEWVLAFVLWCP